MVKIEIMAIEQLLHIPHLDDSYGNLIIFVTTKPNYYKFGLAKFIQLAIADIDAPIINKNDVVKLQNIIVFHPYSTIYVCCDAGLSRSPAIAHFLAVRLKEYKQAEEIEKKYRFLNQELYRKLMEMM